MRTRTNSRAGFTLIEIVAVLLLTTLALVFAGMLIVTSTEIFINSRDAAEDSQKIQVAMNRLVKELSFAGFGAAAVDGNQRSVTWTSAHPDRLGEVQTAEWDGTVGSDLLLEQVALLDNVSLFQVTAADGGITITLRSARTPGIAHSTLVYSRYEAFVPPPEE